MQRARFSKEDFEDVYAVARMAHLGQKRRSGEDYFSHPSEVRNLVRKYYPSDQQAQLVALLHDTLEDAPTVGTVSSKEEMRAWIMSSVADPHAATEILDAVEALTHEKSGPRYDVYVSSLLDNTLALRVKLLDMLHNLSTGPSSKQVKKYANALETLEDIAGGQPNGISREHWTDLKNIVASLMEGDIHQIRLLVQELLLE